ncbi:hypothetical protein EJD97_024724 [Solanum chilense]|uniref:Uncharacterized protein n=1 Tax=Solanum chilense TaxID=4083 RepID=A0A6N2C116_SOLCI|nr:hypothetical protein EJD97_024724 [Solanum chilense]
MQSTRSLGEPLIPYDPEPNKNLRWMENQGVRVNPNNRNPSDGACKQPPLLVEGHNQVLGGNQHSDVLRVKPPASPRLRDYYRGNVNIAYSDRTHVLLPLPPESIFW